MLLRGHLTYSALRLNRTVHVPIRYYSQLQPDKSLVEIWKQKLNIYWHKSQDRINVATERIQDYSTNFKAQWHKARRSIQDVNAKLAQIEREVKDENLNYNDEGKIKDLPSERERHRRKWARKMELYLDSLQETIFTATRALNDVTGYSSIQKLRDTIEALEKELAITKKMVIEYKLKYNDAIQARSESQREVNELLQRKSMWSPNDLDRFTQLYKDDALNSQKEQHSKQELSLLEKKEEELSTKLYRAILTRYHEEQIWSDKIRRTSTWGTFLLMGVNILFFLIFQLLLEPWRRRRLVGSFEDKVLVALDNYHQNQITLLENTVSSNMEGKDVAKDVQPSSQETMQSNGLMLDDESVSDDSIPSFLSICHQIRSWLVFNWYNLGQSIIDILPDASITLQKPYFYSYSTALLALGILVGLIL